MEIAQENPEGRKELDKKLEEARWERIEAEELGTFDAGNFEGDVGVIGEDKGNKESDEGYKETDKLIAERINNGTFVHSDSIVKCSH